MNTVAHDRMMNDDLDRNMGRAGQEDDIGKQDFGKQTPGRNPQGDPSTGQRGAGQKNQPENLDDDEFGEGGSAGRTGEPGGKNR
jgi:hypothetical protein